MQQTLDLHKLLRLYERQCQTQQFLSLFSRAHSLTFWTSYSIRSTIPQSKYSNSKVNSWIIFISANKSDSKLVPFDWTSRLYGVSVGGTVVTAVWRFHVQYLHAHISTYICGQICKGYRPYVKQVIVEHWKAIGSASKYSFD